MEQQPSKSLLGPEQPELFRPEDLPSGWDLLHIEERAEAGKSTGERIAKDRQQYALIVEMLADGLSYRHVARATGISKTTVQAIAHREHGEAAIGTAKKQISNTLRRFVVSASERLADEVDDIPVGQLAVPLAIAVDKMQLLDGEATSRHETMQTRSKQTIEDFDSFIESLPAAQEVASGPVSGREISAAKGAGEERDPGAETGRAECESTPDGPEAAQQSGGQV